MTDGYRTKLAFPIYRLQSLSFCANKHEGRLSNGFVPLADTLDLYISQLTLDSSAKQLRFDDINEYRVFHAMLVGFEVSVRKFFG